MVQAGEFPAGRDLAAKHSDAIFSRYQQFDEARAFYTDVKARVAKSGRNPDEVKILPSSSATPKRRRATGTPTSAAARWIR